LRISIENPKGSVRKGKDKNGKAWANKLAGDYGFFAGTKAIDDDAIDVFIGDNLDSELVTVIDQYFDGKFDESKFVICSATQAKAEKIYLDSYQKGWKLGDVSTTTVQQLKEWLKDGDHKKPFKGQLVKVASVASLFRAAIAARSGTLRRVAC
jgi:inorganic pyrophosphatase